MEFCRQWNGKKGLRDLQCYFYDVNTKGAIVKGICRKENFEFDIPQCEKELIDGQYIICDKCPLNKEH
jgi:hypothetical protein